MIVPVDHVLYPNRIAARRGVAEGERDPTTARPRLRGQQSLGTGRPPVLARLRAGLRSEDDQEGRRLVRQSSRASPKCSRASARRSTASTTPAAATSCSSPSRTVGRPTTGGTTTPKRPHFARTVDIHRKPGYDPVELFFDARTKSIPLNAKLVKGSHGAPPTSRPNAACCSPPNPASSSAAGSPTPTSPTSCCGSLRWSDAHLISDRRNPRKEIQRN